MTLIAALLSFFITVRWDDTPETQVKNLRQIINGGSCLRITFSGYDLEACRDKKTGWIQLADVPFYLQDQNAELCFLQAPVSLPQGNFHD